MRSTRSGGGGGDAAPDPSAAATSRRRAATGRPAPAQPRRLLEAIVRAEPPRELILEALKLVAALREPRRHAGRGQRAQLDLHRGSALVVERLDGVEILVSDRRAKAEAEHLVQRRAFVGTQRAAAGHLERRDAIWPPGTGRKSTEIDLGAIDSARGRGCVGIDRL
jgi:hypothetical protein